MRAFQYAAPRSLDDAIALLARSGARARMLAGGTDFIPQAATDDFEVDLVVDAKRIPELSQLIFDPTGGLTLGAAVPCCRIYEHPDVQLHYPGLVDAVSIIGGTA